MARLQVGCINKRQHHNPHERIQNIGGVAAGVRWKKSEATAILEIESKMNEFFVNISGKSVDVIVAKHEGRKYLKTQPDGYEPNNLLSLPECP